MRRGAAPGDQIFVTGFLGDAAAGLRLMERGARAHQKVVQDVWKNMRSIVCCCDNFDPNHESVGDCYWASSN